MATNKNITMHQFNGVDYDTLYPKTIAEQVEGIYSKQEMLSDDTKTLYGLANSATPDDVFRLIFMSTGTYLFRVTATFSDGSIADEIYLNGIVGFDGGRPRTNAQGIAYGFSDTLETTIAVNDYIGIDDVSVVTNAVGPNEITDVSIVLTKNTDLIKISQSSDKYVHHSISLLDLCAVGAGAGGSNGSQNVYAGNGGGGGYVTNTQLNQIPTSGILKITIGAGGTSGGNAGGKTSVIDVKGNILLEANGGGPDTTGNGTGGLGVVFSSSITATNGSAGTGYIFNEESLGLAGGGGGGGGLKGNGSTADHNQMSGGNPYGGYGLTYYPTRSANGSGPGGGGGGGSAAGANNAGGTGGAGAVYARVQY